MHILVSSIKVNFVNNYAYSHRQSIQEYWKRSNIHTINRSWLLSTKTIGSTMVKLDQNRSDHIYLKMIQKQRMNSRPYCGIRERFVHGAKPKARLLLCVHHSIGINEKPSEKIDRSIDRRKEKLQIKSSNNSK